MKKTELAMVILIFSLVAFSTYLLVNTFIGQASLKPVEVEAAEKIETTVVEPSSKVFSESAINPTVKVKIGDQSSQQPFTVGQ